ncbi:pyruvate kinase [Dichotomopilus funicola]|uniref:Pyruvate kinase n=1 Tax=Dichotomopilus funicola TaxID=1934379 RepID=A0AAN6UV05_9PEZI|nr:pyruvate kinase [Dichotomopilus funicola]
MATALDHLQLGGKIEWLSQLDTAYQPERNLRRTSIICTIGPKTNSVEAINKLREAGLNVVRMNFSHGSYDVRYVDYKNITKVIEPGRIIYVDDGVLAFDVLEIVDAQNIKARARNNGFISSRKGVNLPNTDVDLPALSEKDKNDLRFGVKNNVDMIFASFIRRGQDIKDIREILGEQGRHIQIIAKIENRQGLNNFPEILAETDGVMVARGDLGIEIPAAEVFAAQKKIIAMCNIAGKPVICATQMLESMIKNPRPTRAEISDVGNAVTDGADCVMLSGETAKGSYPNEAVREMSEACLKAENSIPYVSHFEELTTLARRPVPIVESCAMASVRASLDLNASAIFVLSTSGESARLISKYRPVCPIIMITRNPSSSRYGHLYRGVYPFLFPEAKPDFTKVNWQEDVDRRIKWGLSHAIDLGILTEGETVVVVQGWKGGMGNTNTLRIVKADVEHLGIGQLEFMSKSSYLPRLGFSRGDDHILPLHHRTSPPIRKKPSEYALTDLSPQPDESTAPSARNSHKRSPSPSARYRAGPGSDLGQHKPKTQRVLFAGPPPPIASSQMLYRDEEERVTYPAASSHNGASSLAQNIGSVLFDRNPTSPNRRRSRDHDPEQQAIWLNLQRREQALQKDLQRLLDAQSVGLAANLDPTIEQTPSETSDVTTRSATPTSTSTFRTDRSRRHVAFATSTTSSGTIVPVRQPRSKPLSLQGKLGGLLEKPGVKPLDAEFFAHVGSESPGGVEFIKLRPERRTVEMARDWWEGESRLLEKRRQEVEKERAALEEGVAVWKDAVALVSGFETDLRKEIDGDADETASKGKGREGETVSEADLTHTMRAQLDKMRAVMDGLGERLHVAEEHGWNLLICAIGAELEAFRQAKDMLRDALRGSGVDVESDDDEDHRRGDSTPHADRSAILRDSSHLRMDKAEPSGGGRLVDVHDERAPERPASESDNEVPPDLLVAPEEERELSSPALSRESSNDVPSEFLREHSPQRGYGGFGVP